MQKLSSLSNYNTPVLIIGEYGTGKDASTRFLHVHSPNHNSSLITIDCEYLTPEKWSPVAEDINSPLTSQGYTLYFKNIHCLTSEMQSILSKYIYNTMLHKRHRLISSALPHIHAMLEQNKFSSDLYFQIAGTVVQIPSLSERKNDIPAVCTGYVNYFNTLYAKEIIGFAEEAISLMKNHTWYYNIIQLRNVVQQLVVNENSYYISAESVRTVLQKPSSGKEYGQFKTRLNLNQALEDIEREIIKLVLHEEDMNQSRAANRLKISRTTMWRKLKE